MNNSENTERTALIQDAVRYAWYFVLAGFFFAGYGVLKAAFAKEGFSLAGLSELGSYFQGAVGSTWTLAGLLFIYATFLAQREQMARQEKELEDQRKQFEAERADQQKQIEAQRQQFEAQQESIKLQSFESSFFQLLNLQNQITAGLRFQPHSNIPPFRGKDCFEPLCDFLKSRYVERTSFLTENELGHIRAAYQDFHSTAQSLTASYFRNLYHAIKFIQSADVKDKRRYTSLVRAQLSAYEIVLLFYNGLSPVGDGFKPRIELSGLLEHLDDNLLFEPSHKQLYASGAYQ